MDARGHWDGVHADSAPDEVSWWTPEPRVALQLLAEAGVGPDARVLDVGCGQAGLAEHLVARGHRHVAALDVSPVAVERARARLGPRAAAVEWIVADATRFDPPHAFDVWHDRAVLHFLLDEADRARYARAVVRAVRPGGWAVLAAFAPDGPERCSGLPVRRHAPEDLAALVAPSFRLVRAVRETHVTPWGALQPFAWALLRKIHP